MIELRVVPDPLVFPNPEPAFLPLASFARTFRDYQDMVDKLFVIQQQLRAGIISINEAREKMGGL